MLYVHCDAAAAIIRDLGPTSDTQFPPLLILILKGRRSEEGGSSWGVQNRSKSCETELLLLLEMFQENIFIYIASSFVFQMAK